MSKLSKVKTNQMENQDKLIVTLVKNDGNTDPAVFNWVADGRRDAVNIVEKTIKEVREDYKQQGYNEKEYDNFPGTKEWYKRGGKRTHCVLHLFERSYYEFYITDVEDKTKNFFWDCK